MFVKHFFKSTSVLFTTVCKQVNWIVPMRPCYHGNRSKPESGGRGEKSRCPQEGQSSACRHPSTPEGRFSRWNVSGSGWEAPSSQKRKACRGGQRRKEAQGPAGGAGWAQVGLRPPGPGFWGPAARVTATLTRSSGVHLRWWPLGSPGAPRVPHAQPRGAARRGRSCAWGAALPLFLQESCEVRPLQPRQEPPPLSQVGSFPCLEAPVFPEGKSFEGTKLS